MYVKELIAQLQQADPDAWVSITKPAGGSYTESFKLRLVQVEGHPTGHVVLHIERDEGQTAAGPAPL